jgi:hypothetical protein
MTHLSPRAIEVISFAIFMCRKAITGKSTPLSSDDKFAAAVLTALEAEGLVVVPKHITNKMICAVIDATDKKHSPLSCTEFWDVALQAAQGGDDAGQ